MREISDSVSISISEENTKYTASIYNGLMACLESGNKAGPADPRFVDDLPFTTRAKLTIKELEITPPNADTSGPSLLLEVSYGRRGDPGDFVWVVDAAGSLYYDSQPAVVIDQTFLSPYLEKIALGPQGDVTDRRVGMRRRIGPIMVAGTLSSISKLERSQMDATELVELAYQKSYAGPIFEWLKPDKKFESVSLATLGIIGIMTLRTGYEASHLNPGDINNLRHVADPRLQNLTLSQDVAFWNFTNAQELSGSLRETTDAQAEIVASVMLPAYLAAKYGCTNRLELLDSLNRIGLDEVATVFQSPEFTSAMKVLALAPLGTLGHSVGVDAVQATELTWMEENFEASCKPIEIDGGQGFSYYELFTMGSDGRVMLNPRYIAETHKALKLINAGEDYEHSIGCPALLKAVTLNENDISHDQLEAMAEVEGLRVEQQDLGTQLYFERSTIDSLHDLHLATLKQFIESTRAV